MLCNELLHSGMCSQSVRVSQTSVVGASISIARADAVVSESDALEGAVWLLCPCSPPFSGSVPARFEFGLELRVEGLRSPSPRAERGALW